MNKERIQYLVKQHLSGAASVQEQGEFSALLNSDGSRLLFNDVLVEMIRSETPAAPGNQEPWQKMMHGITDIDKIPLPVNKQKAKVLRLYASVAAAILVIAAGFYMFYFKSIIQPGNKNGDGKVAFQVVSTQEGEQKEIILPDSSRVSLNASSTLKFPMAFSGSERVIELTGEAWFGVRHDEDLPFIIHSGMLTTTVLGTAFDIKAYNNNLSVSVKRGKVKVEAGNKLLAVLEKGRKVMVNTDTIASITSIDTAYVAAWREGHLYYKDEPLEDIIADLQRIYEETILVSQNELRKEKITVAFNKSIGIQNALDIICRVTDTRFVRKDGKYYIE